MTFPSGGLFWNTKHYEWRKLILNVSIFAPQLSNGMVDSAKNHQIKFNGDTILEWFQDQIEWQIHFAQSNLKRWAKMIGFAPKQRTWRIGVLCPNL